MTNPEEFMEKRDEYIHVNTPDEAEDVLNFYSQFGSTHYSTVNIKNWHIYPYFYYSRGVHGQGKKPRSIMITEYADWAALVNISDFEASEKPISFLLS